MLPFTPGSIRFPADYQEVLKSLDRKGDYKAGVLKVNLSALLENGIDATALHNPFFSDDPHVYFVHVHGVGKSGGSCAPPETGLGLDWPCETLAGSSGGQRWHTARYCEACKNCGARG
jgi:Domain of Unknown Function (DUF1259)